MSTHSAPNSKTNLKTKSKNNTQKSKIQTQIKTISVFVFCVVIVILAYFYKRYTIYKSIVKPSPPVMIVNFAKVKSSLWAPLVNAIGTVHSSDGVALKSQVAGVLVKSLVKPGDNVKKGDLLYAIFSKEQEADIEKAKAQLLYSKSYYERQKRIFAEIGESGVSKQTLEDAYYQYKQDQENLRSFEAKLSFYKIKSPINGRIGVTDLRIGNYIKIGDIINHVMPLGSLEVYFSIPAEQAANISPNNIVNYTYLSDLSKNNEIKTLSGKVLAVDNRADPDTHMQMIHASFPDDSIIPGRYIEVSVEAGAKKQVMVVPEMSVLGGQYGHYVYQVINGRAVRKIVKTGVRRDDLIEIKSGLMPGDTIILNGQTKVLFPGIQVTDKGAIKPENIKY